MPFTRMPVAGFGQLALSAPAIKAIQQGPSWASWPTAWQRGVGATIAPPAPGAWTAPEGLGRVVGNLATMVKRMEAMGHTFNIGGIGLTVHVDYGPPKTVRYTFNPIDEEQVKREQYAAYVRELEAARQQTLQAGR